MYIKVSYDSANLIIKEILKEWYTDLDCDSKRTKNKQQIKENHETLKAIEGVLRYCMFHEEVEEFLARFKKKPKRNA